MKTSKNSLILKKANYGFESAKNILDLKLSENIENFRIFGDRSKQKNCLTYINNYKETRTTTDSGSKTNSTCSLRIVEIEKKDNSRYNETITDIGDEKIHDLSNKIRQNVLKMSCDYNYFDNFLNIRSFIPENIAGNGMNSDFLIFDS